MFRSFCRGRLLPFALFAVLGLTGAAAFAAGGPTIGVVDYAKIYQSYTAFQTASDRFSTFKNEQKEPLEALRLGIGLSADDLKLFQNLHRLGDGNRSPEQETQYKSLADKARKNYTEYQTLAEKKKNDKLTDDDTKRLAELTTLVEPVFKLYDAMGPEVEQKVTSEGQRLQSILSKEIADTISKVAKAQKLTIVLNKDIATSNETSEKIVIWYDDSLDISDKMLVDLNAHFKQHPEILDKPAAAPTPAPSPAPTPAPTHAN